MFQTLDLNDLGIRSWEWLALPFYIVIILIIANNYKKSHESDPIYKYYVTGLFAKILGGVFFSLIYIYYYKGGDTFSYFQSAQAMRNLMLTDPLSYLQNEFGEANWEHFSLFSQDIGYPMQYIYFNPQTYMVVRLINPILAFTFNSYILTTVVIAWLSYAGIWRMFRVFTGHYPKRVNLFAIALLFFPSVLFWGSGILKDTITLSCTGWVLFSINNIFIIKKGRIWNSLILIVCIFLIFSIKPYIIFALLPGSLMWIFSNRIYALRNAAIKFLIIPFIIIGSIAGGYFILSSLESSLGKYSLHQITNTALVMQDDMKKDYYHGHAFDIGLAPDETTTGLLKKFPVALAAGIYRPYIWECPNAVMLISGMENTIILLLSISSLLRIFRSPGLFFRKMFSEPLLFFTLTFSIFFAFSVGLTTSNFGALVRFKIAYLPFFLCALFIMLKRKDEKVGAEDVFIQLKSESLKLA